MHLPQLPKFQTPNSKLNFHHFSKLKFQTSSPIYCGQNFINLPPYKTLFFSLPNPIQNPELSFLLFLDCKTDTLSPNLLVHLSASHIDTLSSLISHVQARMVHTHGASSSAGRKRTLRDEDTPAAKAKRTSLRTKRGSATAQQAQSNQANP